MTSYPSDSQQTCDWEPNKGNNECDTKLDTVKEFLGWGGGGIKSIAWDFEGVRTGRNKKGAKGSST